MLLRHDNDAVAIIDDASGTTLTHRQLRAAVNAKASEMGPGLLFLFAANDLDSVLTYLGALESGMTVALLDRRLKDEFAQALIDLYRPEWTFGFNDAGLEHHADDAGELYPGLSVLLSTSGSTGTPKFVRLSDENIVSNTEAIITSLNITERDRAVTTLPLNYSYGMSVVNSHIYAGASIVITDRSVIEPAFWTMMERSEVTSLAGVPFTYQMLSRLGFAKRELGHLEKLTQAGGKLSDPLTRQFLDDCRAKGREFYVMYGQTEAAPRISCVPANMLDEKFGSAGRVLDGGQLSIRTMDGTQTSEPGVVGEVLYRGPNVMLGYAETRADLALGDVQGGVLETGDLGYLDPDGFLFITGRARRIAKVFGVRVNLDEIENMVAELPSAAVVEYGDGLHVFHLPYERSDEVRRQLAHDLRVPLASVQLHEVDAILTNANNKPDYQRMTEILKGNK